MQILPWLPSTGPRAEVSCVCVCVRARSHQVIVCPPHVLIVISAPELTNQSIYIYVHVVYIYRKTKHSI